jgi:hypothetical protein
MSAHDPKRTSVGKKQRPEEPGAVVNPQTSAEG